MSDDLSHGLAARKIKEATGHMDGRVIRGREEGEGLHCRRAEADVC